LRVQDAAFKSTNLSRYKWVVTNRTDTLPKYPFCPRCVAGDVSLRRLVDEFCDFGLRVAALVRGPIEFEPLVPAIKQHMFYWLAGAGNFQFAYTRTTAGRMRRSALSPWCPESVPRCLLDMETEELRGAIAKIPANELKDPASLRWHLKRLVKDLRISWLAGSTWMRLGATSQIVAATNSAITNWGRNFHEADLTNSTNVDQKFRDVTESQLRMAMFKEGTMIELHNKADYWVSFNEKQAAMNIPEKLGRFSTIYFIVRESEWPRSKPAQ
jgi:hypothetical protein